MGELVDSRTFELVSGIEADEVQVVSAYTLAYGCGLLFSGRIADVYGRKLCFLLGSAIFVIFNVVSGAVQVSWLL